MDKPCRSLVGGGLGTEVMMILGEFAIKDKENKSDLEIQASGGVCL